MLLFTNLIILQNTGISKSLNKLREINEKDSNLTKIEELKNLLKKENEFPTKHELNTPIKDDELKYKPTKDGEFIPFKSTKKFQTINIAKIRSKIAKMSSINLTPISTPMEIENSVDFCRRNENTNERTSYTFKPNWKNEIKKKLCSNIEQSMKNRYQFLTSSPVEQFSIPFNNRNQNVNNAHREQVNSNDELAETKVYFTHISFPEMYANSMKTVVDSGKINLGETDFSGNQFKIEDICKARGDKEDSVDDNVEKLEVNRNNNDDENELKKNQNEGNYEAENKIKSDENIYEDMKSQTKDVLSRIPKVIKKVKFCEEDEEICRSSENDEGVTKSSLKGDKSGDVPENLVSAHHNKFSNNYFNFKAEECLGRSEIPTKKDELTNNESYCEDRNVIPVKKTSSSRLKLKRNKENNCVIS